MHLGGSEWKTYYGRKNEPGEQRSDKDDHPTDIKLTEEDLKRLDAILPPGAAAGQRYHERGMETVNR